MRGFVSLSGKNKLEIDSTIDVGNFPNFPDCLLQVNAFVAVQLIERASRARVLSIFYVRERLSDGPTQCE